MGSSMEERLHSIRCEFESHPIQMAIQSPVEMIYTGWIADYGKREENGV